MRGKKGGKGEGGGGGGGGKGEEGWGTGWLGLIPGQLKACKKRERKTLQMNTNGGKKRKHEKTARETSTPARGKKRRLI